jgi:hypothetical protein
MKKFSIEELKKEYPPLWDLYDENDPQNTIGSKEYFIEVLNEMLEAAEESNDKEWIENIEKTMDFVSQFDELCIY